MHILLLEEEPRVRSFLVRALAAEGLAVEEVSEQARAVRQGHESRAELVIADIERVGPQQLALLLQFRRQLPGVPVLALADSGDLATKLRCFELGVVDYLVKPFSIEELIARVRVHLRRRPGGAQLRAGELALDEQTREALLDGRTISLTDKEFKVLRHLLTYAGQVVSRERLLAAVWGYDFDPQSNVVDVCIRRLRKRLGPDAPIETVRNAGYRIALGRAELEGASGTVIPLEIVRSPDGGRSRLAGA